MYYTANIHMYYKLYALHAFLRYIVKTLFENCKIYKPQAQGYFLQSEYNNIT